MAYRWVCIRDSSPTFTIMAKTRIAGRQYGPKPITITSAAEPAFNTDKANKFYCALTHDITDMSTNGTGTPEFGDTLWFMFAVGDTKTINWGSLFEEGENVPLPTSFDVPADVKFFDVGFRWNPTNSAWRIVAFA